MIVVKRIGIALLVVVLVEEAAGLAIRRGWIK